MSFRIDMLAVAGDLRQLPQDEFDIRTTRVIRRLRAWTPASGSAEVGKGLPTNGDLEIDPRPKVIKTAPDRFEVGPITPASSGGGYTYDQLNPVDVAGTDFHYVLIGPSGREAPCTLIDIKDRKAFSYYLVLQSRDRSDPD